jgi:dihydroorotase
MSQYDWIIRGGRVLDPANGLDGQFDVAIANGRIAAVEARLDAESGAQVWDASGKLVTPGLVDLHAHTYDRVTPLGIDADHYCLGRGVTTAVDTGSAGYDIFPGFRKFAVEPSRTRLLAFLNISRIGLAIGRSTDGDEPGELEALKLISRDKCVDCINENEDILIGVKVRLSASIADNGRNESEAYRQSREAAEVTGLPLMTHHSFSTVSLEECPGLLRAGDVYTHCFHGFETTVIDPQSRQVHAAVLQARDRGILFDIGHGMGGFNYTVAEICIAAGIWPHAISTDMHTLTCEGPAYDMPTVMTKLMALGMPLVEVIRASTIAPAEAIGWGDRIGTLGVGREADVAVLSLDEVDMELEDCIGQMRRIDRRLVAAAVWRAGEPGRITEPQQFPNQAQIDKSRANAAKAVVRDD